MYCSDDTIAALSSVGTGPRVILRLSGSGSFGICERLFMPQAGGSAGCFSGLSQGAEHSRVLTGRVSIDEGLSVEGFLYLFLGPFSYTGQDLAELHIQGGEVVARTLMERLLTLGSRAAEPGEFTARAYLNGKLDLSQAEAVNEVIAGSNACQLLAAQKLLGGRLSKTTEQIRSALMELMSLIEAGLDFSEEAIEFVSRADAAQRIREILDQLEQLLAGSIQCERVLDMPSVGIAGAPNAGKSSLLNRLLGRERSLVSDQRKTTRDVLDGVVTLEHCDCVFFDCAGLPAEPGDVLDRLAQDAALEALRHSSLILFCVDMGCGQDVSGGGCEAAELFWVEQRDLLGLVERVSSAPVVVVATRSDLPGPGQLVERVEGLASLLGRDVIVSSARDGRGLEQLRWTVDDVLAGLRYGGTSGPLAGAFSESAADRVGLTVRHRKAVRGAIENVTEAEKVLLEGSDEVAVMFLRSAYEELAQIDRPGAGHIDQRILDEIFGRFCIGK